MPKYRVYFSGFSVTSLEIEADAPPEYGDTGKWVDVGHYRVRERMIVAVEDTSGGKASSRRQIPVSSGTRLTRG